MQSPIQFAATNGNVLSALGINVQSLVIQLLAFLVLVFLLGRFVYPWLMKSVDQRAETIEAARRAADEAKDVADRAKETADAVLDEARAQAADIVSTARTEAASAIAASEERAGKRAATIIENAQAQLQKDVRDAQATLRNDTIELVALATERIVGRDPKVTDKKLIDRTLDEVRS